MNATTNQKERRKDNEMYDDYYYEPSEFEQQIEEFKQSLLRSVKIEHVEEIERLRKENAELQATKKRMKEIETEHTVAMRQFSLDKQKYETELKNKRIAELLGDYMLIGWYPSSHTIRKPKCNKCDQNRNIHFKSPSGKDYTEECSTCGGGVSFYEPEEIECYRFSQRKDYYGSKLPPVEKYCKKAAAMRYYNRNKPVHIPTTKPEETVTRRNEPESPDNVPDKEYPGLLRLWAELLYGETHKTDKTAKTARTLMRGAAARYELLLNTQKPTAVEPNINIDALLGSHDALYMHAIQIRTLTDILHLVLQGAEGGQKHYDRLMSQLDFMFDALSETADTLKTEVGALEDTIIKISPEAATSKAD